MLAAIKKQGKTIVFIDEAHMMNGAGAGGGGNSNDLANMLNVQAKVILKLLLQQLGTSIENTLKKIVR